MEKNSKIYVAGHTGLAGSALVRELKKQGYTNIVTRTHNELDLTDADKTDLFFNEERPEYVFMCAGLVGGILANNNNKDSFFYENMMMGLNTIKSADKYNVKKFVYFGSSCIYPNNIYRDINESDLMNGPLETANEGYALAKIGALRYCNYLWDKGKKFISVMPTNLYGPNDNYDFNTSHVLPGLIAKFDYAKRNVLNEVTFWGNGTAIREFMFSDDMAKAVIMIMNNYDEREHINVANGNIMTIKELADIIKDVVGFKGKIKWDTSKPNGTMCKTLNTIKLKKLGFNVHTDFIESIRITYEDYLNNYDKN